jgi:PBSX family phage terminase large subunit
VSEVVYKAAKLHKVQLEFRRSEALYRGFVGGIGSGKSWVGAFDLVRRLKAGCTYMVGSPTGVLMGDTTFPTFRSMLDNFLLRHTIKLTPYPNVTVWTNNGPATVRFRTAEDPDKMRGPNLSGVWLDEASLMHEDAYKVAIGRLREHGKQGWLSATFTPKGKYHWTHEVFNTGKPNVAIFRSHTKQNPFNPPEYATNLAQQYSPQFALQELAGEFLNIEGAEFPSAWFPESMWFRDYPEPRHLSIRVVAVDSSMGRSASQGDYSAIVDLTRDSSGILWVEANLERRPVTQIVTDGIRVSRQLERETGGLLDGFGVEADVFQELVANEFIRQSRAEGIQLPVYKILTEGVSKLVRIRRLTSYLSTGVFRFRDTPGTRLLVRQLQEFPVGEHDDGPDALEMALRLAIQISHKRQQ